VTTAIRVEELRKLYRRMAPGFQLRTLKSALLDRSLIHGLRPDETIPALSGVSFEVREGEAFGVIGRNGSGKSTLLKLLVGMLKPSSGTIEVMGRVAALIELGAGFHPEISGRENIYINGAVLGMSRREIDERYDDIVEFSGLADFIDEPVKNYSSGMYVRLGFAVAIHTEPDVLLVDEVLAVGDEAFTHRCLRRIEEFLARGKTLLLVSHSLGMIEEFSDRVLWLDDGRCRLLGSPRFVVDAYRKAVAEEEGRGHQEAKDERARRMELEEPPPDEAQPAPDGEKAEETRPAEAEPGSGETPATEEVLRWGSREAEVTSVRLLDREGRERYYFDSGEEVCFEIEVVARRPLTDVVFGVGLFTPRGTECWGTNTHLEGYASAGLDSTATARVVCPALRLAPGEYLLDVAVHSREGYPYDYQRRALSFTVTSRADGVGIYFPEHRWEFAGGIRWRQRPEES
jgi:ABC-type polysaccharide/polyol phosphate transport system ATPase subunit